MDLSHPNIWVRSNLGVCVCVCVCARAYKRDPLYVAASASGCVCVLSCVYRFKVDNYLSVCMRAHVCVCLLCMKTCLVWLYLVISFINKVSLNK